MKEEEVYKHFKAEGKRDAGIADNHVTRCHFFVKIYWFI